MTSSSSALDSTLQHTFLYPSLVWPLTPSLVVLDVSFFFFYCVHQLLIYIHIAFLLTTTLLHFCLPSFPAFLPCRSLRFFCALVTCFFSTSLISHCFYTRWRSTLPPSSSFVIANKWNDSLLAGEWEWKTGWWWWWWCRYVKGESMHVPLFSLSFSFSMLSGWGAGGQQRTNTKQRTSSRNNDIKNRIRTAGKCK